MANTRSPLQIWLVEAPAATINKLPLPRDAMSIFYRPKELKQTLKQSISTTVFQVMEVWRKVGIPTARFIDIVKRLLKVYFEW